MNKEQDTTTERDKIDRFYQLRGWSDRRHLTPQEESELRTLAKDLGVILDDWTN